MRPRGCPTRRAGFALVLACAASAAAADVYKIVGPDGRVTFSDRPPVGTDGSHSAIVAHATASSARLSISALPPTSAGVTGTPPGAASAPRAAEEDRARAPLAPALSQALVAVLAGEDRVQSLFEACTRAQPEAYERFSDHLRTWRHRNVQIITQADRVMAIGLSSSGRAALQAAARSEVDADLAPVLRGPRSRLVQWCSQGADQLLDGTLDIAGRPAITEPIARWVAP